MELLSNVNIDFISKRKMAFIISGFVLIIGIASLIMKKGPDFGIDFRGGVQIQAQFNTQVSTKAVEAKLAEIGYPGADVVKAGKNEVLIKLGHSAIDEEGERISLIKDPGGITADAIVVANPANSLFINTLEKGDILEIIEGNKKARGEVQSFAIENNQVKIKFSEQLGKDFSENATLSARVNVGRVISRALENNDTTWHAVHGGINISEVGPNIGQDLQKAALLSVFFAMAILLGYISWRFELRFAVGAIAALFHDVLVTLGIFSILSREINLPTIAAFLTIVGYSLNDTIVIFDRIRENHDLMRGSSYDDIINTSISQSLSRTIITSLTTLAVVFVIFILSGPGELNTFALALIIGVIVGTYSSVFVASPILHGWHLRLQER